MLFARALTLRNCGRFTHISSDYGSQYHTHTFVTSEALYASLTRGVTWRHASRFINLEEDSEKSIRDDYFLCDYDVQAKPIWFMPGVFVDEQLQPLRKERSVIDKNDFNVVDEEYPSTGGDGRPYYVPTYGRIESILPDHRLLIYALSPDREELEWFTTDQIFLMGKKRTMFQIINLYEITGEIKQHGKCHTWWLELPSDFSTRFQSFEILGATLRYIILRGTTQPEMNYSMFTFAETSICLPDFYVERIPFKH